MRGFDWRKNIKDSIKDILIITATTTGNFFALKAAGLKSPKAYADPIHIMKCTGEVRARVLVKDYVLYKKWTNE